jgi:outer membrane lipoprotein-sorting protein
MLGVSKHERGSLHRPARWQAIALWIVFLLVFASGCTPRQPPRVLPPSPSAEHLLASLEARRQTLVALRGAARVEYQDAHERGSARQALVVARPDRFRLETFSPVGIAFLTTSDGKTLAAYFPRENTIYRGAATPLNIARYLRVVLSVKEVVNLLLGFPPVLSQVEGAVHTSVAEARVSFAGDQGRYRLELSLSNVGKQVLWFDNRTLLLAKSEDIAPDGSLLFTASFADYREINSLRFPFEITFYNEQRKWRVTLHYERVELNPDLADNLFSLPSRPGVKEVGVDAVLEE